MQNRAMYPETIHPPLGAYAHAIEVPESAKTMFIAGQVGIDAHGNVPADFAAQADLAWQNLMAILEFNGMRMKDVVKITHFLTDAANLPAYNDVRSKYLGEERPASTLLIVAGLARPDLLVEVEMVAAIQR
ncbi:MAG: Rid family hydrolase [Defluviicoccus sp.]|nr:Rid family hydrolase [Defluviicoccus sp.]MDE0274312.1 Rid family hydrolase [Defluviicoccus sp.]